MGDRPFTVNVDAAGEYVYVGNYDNFPAQAAVKVIDTATNLVTATVEVGLDATGVATSPDGTRVYVTNKGRSDVAGSAAVSVIDTATETVVATVPLLGDPADVGPLGVVVSPDGGRVYVTDGNQFFNRPGPRLAESLEILAEILHPGVFPLTHEGMGWQRYQV